MTPEQKEWIDESSYESLLERWRNAPVGDEMFIGETGKYYKEVMARKRDSDPDDAVRASKAIGWNTDPKD